MLFSLTEMKTIKKRPFLCDYIQRLLKMSDTLHVCDCLPVAARTLTKRNSWAIKTGIHSKKEKKNAFKCTAFHMYSQFQLQNKRP